MYKSEDPERFYQVTDADLDKVEAFSKAKKTSVLVVFFDDMKGSTALKQKMTAHLDEEAFQRLRREHDELLTEIITRDGAGEVIKSTGDGLLAVFSEPSSAVERAIEIQEKLYGHQYISIRIGMDMGQVRVEAAGGTQRDLFGRHVDWAARAESMADGGHIIVTRSVYTDAFGWIPKSHVSWKEHGFYIVKEGEQAIEVFEPYNSNITRPMESLHGKRENDLSGSALDKATFQDSKDAEGRLDARLFIVLGDGHIGPIDLGIYSHDLPAMLTSSGMDEPFELPATMRTTSPRRVFWKEGRRFLENSRTYGEQGVRQGHSLILTDQPDAELVVALIAAFMQ